jgi:hypothetical protein
MLDIVQSTFHMRPIALHALPSSRKMLKGKIFWSKDGTDLIGESLAAVDEESFKARIYVQLAMERYDCAPRRLEHLNQALTLFLPASRERHARAPMNAEVVYVFPEIGGAAIRGRQTGSEFCHLDNLRNFPLVLRHFVLDLGIHDLKREDVREWVVRFVCHILPALSSGYKQHLLPTSEPLPDGETQPSFTVLGLKSVNLASNLICAVSLFVTLQFY